MGSMNMCAEGGGGGGESDASEGPKAAQIARSEQAEAQSFESMQSGAPTSSAGAIGIGRGTTAELLSSLPETALAGPSSRTEAESIEPTETRSELGELWAAFRRFENASSPRSVGARGSSSRDPFSAVERYRDETRTLSLLRKLEQEEVRGQQKVTEIQAIAARQ